MKQDCRECGLGIYVPGDSELVFCHAAKKAMPPEKQPHDWECLYYQSKIYEDGQLLTPEQHYLIRKNELDRKK